ncbi:DMT family transporter [Mangrovicoccus ximenensis]|uniref:DMT family transporter n=1 Tax=Mangrovicoccus ximenensis TaxID=1911570 RepID=UPI000D3C7797|nr:DMT family transporter [Mangrovicoccus ximenensis]
MAASDRSLLVAITLKVLYVLLTVVMLSLVRAMDGVPVTQVMFFRCFFAILPVLAFLAWRSELKGMFRTSRPLAHARRTVMGVTCTGLTFVAVQNLPLPEAVTLQYSQPLFVVALSAIFLGEQVRAFRWGAVAFGFAGVLVVSWPKLTLLADPGQLSHAQLVGVSAALAGSAGVATVLLLVGDLVRTERPATITAWSWLVSSSLLAFTAFGGWVMPSLQQAVLLVLTGIIGGTIQLLMAQSLKFAPASATAAFEYTSLIFAAAIGFYVFGDIPGLNTLAGGAMVIAAGLLIIWRERRRGKARAARTGLVPSS